MLNVLIDYGKAIATLASALLVVVVTALLGLWAYFRQKEYELVRERYLEQGIDVLIHHVETALSVFQFNFTHSLLVLKTFRDLGADMPSRLYETGFLDLDKVTMVPTRNYLLQELIGDDVCYKIHQLMMVFVHDANNFFMNDLCSMLRVKINGGREIGVKATREEIVEIYMQHCVEYEKQAHRFWILLGNLQNIAFAFEKERFTFKKLRTFRKDASVKKSIAVLREQFAEDLNNTEEYAPTKDSTVPSEGAPSHG